MQGQSTTVSSPGPAPPIVKPKKRLMSIRWTLPLLVVTPVILGIVLTNRLVARSGRAAIEESIEDIGTEVASNIEREIIAYLEKPILLSASVVSKAESGVLDTTDMEPLSLSFWQAIQTNLLPDSLYYGNELGELAYSRRKTNETPIIRVRNDATNQTVITYGIDSDGNLDTAAVADADRSQSYDPRERPWYEAAEQSYKNAQNGNEALPTWVPVYADQQTQSLVLTLVTPVQSASNQLEVFASDIFLSDLNTFLKTLTDNQNRNQDEYDIRAFIVDKDSNLIATSAGKTLTGSEGDWSLIAAKDSSDQVVQKAAVSVTEWEEREPSENSLHITTKEEGEQLVYVQDIRHAPIAGHESFKLPEWQIVVTIPQANYMGPLHRSNRNSIVWGGLITILASLLAVFGVRLILKPIEKLNQAASDIKHNRFDPRTLADVMRRPDEFSTLADVFDDMATVVVSREHTLAEQVKQLETEKSQFGGKQGDRHALEIAMTHARQARKRYQNQ